jgi:hypothetical protein
VKGPLVTRLFRTPDPALLRIKGMLLSSVRLMIRFAFRLLIRFGFWVPAAYAFSVVKPLSQWNEGSKSRFAYACMMGRESSLVRKIVAALISRELGRSEPADLWLAKIAWSMDRIRLAVLIYRQTIRRGSHLRKVSQCMEQFATGIAEQRIPAQLSQAIDQLHLPDRASGPIVLAPVSTRYLDLFGLWIEQLDRLMPGHRLLLALDKNAAVRLSENYYVLDLPDFFVFNEGGVIDQYTRGNLWILRVLILRELAARGYTILSLDLDALVVGDLPGLLGSLPDSDIVAQMDYSIPTDVARRLGFIICCGFMLIRSNPTTVDFLNRYASRTILEMDDQLALNHLLVETGIAQGERNERYVQFNAAGVSWVCPAKSLVSRDISFGTVIRHFQQRAGDPIEKLRKAISK